MSDNQNQNNDEQCMYIYIYSMCYQCLQENRSVYFLSDGTPLGFVGVSKVSCDASKRVSNYTGCGPQDS